MTNIESTIEIVPQNFDGEVKELKIGRGGNRLVSEHEFPIKILVMAESDSSIYTPAHKVATPVAKLTKQTGTHSIHTSNGFSATGTIEELADNLRNFGIELSVQDDVMMFTNTLEQEVSINIQAKGRSGKTYVAIEQENTHIDLDGKNAEFKLTAVIVATNDVPSVARLSHGNNLYNLRVNNGFSTKPRFSISISEFVKAGIHAYVENGQLVLSNRTPEEITVDLSTYDAEFMAVEQANKTVQINGKSVRLTLGAYRGVDFNHQQAIALPLLTDIIIPEGRYAVSYRVNDGEIKTVLSNSMGQVTAQNILANVMYYERLMPENLVSNGTYSSNDEESRIRPFLVDYQKSLQSADSNHPNFIRHAHFKIEFLLTENAEHDFEHDFVKLAFGKNTEIHSYAIANWINTPINSSSSSMPEPDGRPMPEPNFYPDSLAD